jgi:Organic solute transporter Ostalpha
MWRHLTNFSMPVHQRHIIRILLMVPLYSIYSLVALIFYKYQVYFSVLRDAYESYVLYQFLALCVAYVGGHRAIVAHFCSRDRMQLSPPFCRFGVEPDEQFLMWLKRGIMQYMLVRPLMAIVAIVLEALGLYGDGELGNFAKGYVYIAVVNNISLTVALYCLVVFYQASADALRPYKPVLKFLAIKTLIFFTYWQGVLIALLVLVSAIPSAWGLDEGEFAVAIQNFAITIEMIGIAVLHMYAFPSDIYDTRVRPLVAEVAVKPTIASGVVSSFDQRDVLHDTATAFAFSRRHPKPFHPRDTIEGRASDYDDDVADADLEYYSDYDSDLDRHHCYPSHEQSSSNLWARTKNRFRKKNRHHSKLVDEDEDYDQDPNLEATAGRRHRHQSRNDHSSSLSSSSSSYEASEERQQASSSDNEQNFERNSDLSDDDDDRLYATVKLRR